MKTIALIRHAKSSWEEFGVSDFERPLNQRGRRDAPVMASRLQKLGFTPDLLVSSTAKRARKTAKLFAEVLGIDKGHILLLDELYLAEPENFERVIAKLDDRFNRIAVFAHNPGITTYANRMNIARIEDMPTCAIFAFTADTDNWKDVGSSEKKFLFFDQPKSIES
jgi:phosphohistidine phosphatase